MVFIHRDVNMQKLFQCVTGELECDVGDGLRFDGKARQCDMAVLKHSCLLYMTILVTSNIFEHEKLLIVARATYEQLSAALDEGSQFDKVYPI